MKKKLLLTALVILITSLAFGQIIVPKVNKSFVISKDDRQLKGLEQNDYQRNLGFLLLGQKSFTQNLSMKSASVKQKLDSTVERSWKVNDWVKSTKDEYTYDANGKWTVGVYYNWNDTTKVWVRDTKDEYTYNANGKWATDVNSKWNKTSSQWVNNTKEEFTYDANGYFTQILISDWNATTSQWVKASKEEFTYNASGYYTQILISDWDVTTSQWVASMKYVYTYDANGKNTLMLASSWDTVTSQWVNFMKYEFTYNASGKMTIGLYSIWMDNTSQWTPFMKNEYTYDANGRTATDTRSDLDFPTMQLVLNSKYEFTYDSNGNMIQDLVSKWNVTTNLWVFYSKDVSTYNLSYNFSDLIFPSGFSMAAISFLNSTTDASNMPVEDIEYLRDNTNSVWNNNTKTNYYFSVNTGTGINELKADEQNKLIVYPNPVSDGFRLNTSEKNVRISIYDLSGSLLLTKQISGDEYIDINTLPQGMYMVRATTEKGSVTKKIVKK
ncbi:T9SS type A sorting domain-containing protein [uncultured Bacteroides sp.]|uniref:T9SS type A sorting domain-containing protein n=1 Tax=uncultured Bacteroides sp. TaxID=162156 RepID=UPI002AA64C40|nr:T9SS type A sorting domain-containing protein [uncultured Bacteroides sp.]